MNREEIMKILPHRDNMLLIDEVEAVSEDRALGKYTVRGDEWFLQGHFPGNPVVPGVIQCEIMAQTCCVLLAGRAAASQSKMTPYFTSLDKVKFRKPVLPGDTLELECQLLKVREPFYFAKGTGRVGGKVCVSGEFSFACVADKE